MATYILNNFTVKENKQDVSFIPTLTYKVGVFIQTGKARGQFMEKTTEERQLFENEVLNILRTEPESKKMVIPGLMAYFFLDQTYEGALEAVSGAGEQFAVADDIQKNVEHFFGVLDTNIKNNLPSF